MALLTQKALMTTFEEMLEEMQFDKITVSALVKRCGISPNTFYYHYQDIYALLNTWLSRKIGEMRAQSGDSGGWREEAKIFLHYCQEHPKTIYHIFDSLSREQLERYVFSSTEDSFAKQVRLRVEGKNLTEEHVDEIIQFCKFAYMGFFIKFLWNRMDFDVDKSVDRLGTMFENFVYGEINRAAASETSGY